MLQPFTDHKIKTDINTIYFHWSFSIEVFKQYPYEFYSQLQKNNFLVKSRTHFYNYSNDDF